MSDFNITVILYAPTYNICNYTHIHVYSWLPGRGWGGEETLYCLFVFLFTPFSTATGVFKICFLAIKTNNAGAYKHMSCELCGIMIQRTGRNQFKYIYIGQCVMCAFVVTHVERVAVVTNWRGVSHEFYVHGPLISTSGVIFFFISF